MPPMFFPPHLGEQVAGFRMNLDVFITFTYLHIFLQIGKPKFIMPKLKKQKTNPNPRQQNQPQHSYHILVAFSKAPWLGLLFLSKLSLKHGPPKYTKRPCSESETKHPIHPGLSSLASIGCWLRSCFLARQSRGPPSPVLTGKGSPRIHTEGFLST